MRFAEVLAGSSHPELSKRIFAVLDIPPSKCVLGQFANGETSVVIDSSVREKAVFIIQSGSASMNDSLVELLIMISACAGSSASKITAVMPYFPYSRQSKKKSHRGAITARLLANLLSMAGMSHLVTVDLHSAQVQGFFKQPVDNLSAQRLIVNWIRSNVSSWSSAVVVSKNPGGTKRATALADALEVDFGVITTAKRRWNMNGSSASQSPIVHSMEEDEFTDAQSTLPRSALAINEADGRDQHPLSNGRHTDAQVTMSSQPDGRESYTLPLHARIAELHDVSSHPRPAQLRHSQTFPASPLQLPRSEPHDSSMGTSDSGHNVTIGRLVQGHIVDDDYPPPSLQSSNSNLPELGGFTGVTHQPEDRAGLDGIMSASFMSFGSSTGGGPIRGTGASMDDDASDNEDADLMNPAVEHEITLVGHVKGKTVLIVDDMIDSSSSWIAAAECCVKRGGARAVFLFATHGLFAGGTALEELEKCDCIEKVVVTNTFPIPDEVMRRSRKLVVLDIAPLLAEAIRRNHHGESMCNLYM